MSYKDEREAKVPVPATKADTEALARWLSDNAAEGYNLKSVVTVSSGDQRDPYTVGVKIILGKNHG